ncbi:MAG: hydratase [Alphaproteobacteria bacterium]|nr:hydratase [Alphaproteobacteria bacterium]
MLRTLLIGALAVVAGSATAAAQGRPCGPVDHARAIHQAWLKKTPVASPGRELGMEEAVCQQRRLVQLMSQTLGPRAGYKVGLTSQAAQQALGVSTPVVGVMLQKMFLESGARIRTQYAARPIVEADLVVVVGDGAINEAKTPSEVARHLRALHPFIELPDLVVAEGQPLTGAVVVAIDVGARLGVLGKPVKMRSDPEFVDALAKMMVKLSDDQGRELSAAPGAAILGHPLNAVMVLAEELKRRGERLKPGDRISLGSFGRPVPPPRGRTLTASYAGLPTGPMSVSVTFR